MVALSSLWLPILLASVAVFFLSFVLRMVSTHHLSDFDKLPDEDAVRDALRSAGVGEGQYAFPHCGSFADMKSEAFQASWAEGPTGMLYVCPKGPWTMGKSLGQWFVMTLFVSSVVAWIAGLVIAPGAEWKAVAKVTGTIAFMSYGRGLKAEAEHALVDASLLLRIGTGRPLLHRSESPVALSLLV